MARMDDIKRQKETADIEFYTLRKKAKDNTPMTAEENRKLSSYKTREIVNQVLRIFGLITALMLFVLVFDMFAEGTVWGIFKGKGTITEYWRLLLTRGGESAYEADGGFLNLLWWFFRSEEGIVIFCAAVMTIIHLILCGAIVYLLAYSIKDIIVFFKKLILSPVKIIKDVSDTTKDSVKISRKEIAEEGLPINLRGAKKTLFDETPVTEEPKRVVRKKPAKKVEEVKPVEITTPEPVKASEKVEETKAEEKIGGYTNEELDRLLKGETLADIRPVEEIEIKEARDEIKEDAKEVQLTEMDSLIKEREIPTKSLDLEETEEESVKEVEEPKVEKRSESSPNKDFLDSIRRLKR